MATSLTAKKTTGKNSLERLSADADKAAVRAEEAKDQVRSAKADLKKARKAAKLAKKAAKQAKKKIEAARAAAAPPVKARRRARVPGKPKASTESKPAKNGAGLSASGKAVSQKTVTAKATATGPAGAGLRHSAHSRPSPGDVAKAVINRMAAKRAHSPAEPAASPAPVSGAEAAAPAA